MRCELLDDCLAAEAHLFAVTGNSVNLCLNGGRCNYQSGNCQCLLSFNGSICEEKISPCDSLAPCQNGAACTDLVNGYICECGSTGYRGTTCSELVPVCSSNPCGNGASCTQTGPNVFDCSCAPGFQGLTCSEEIDECSAQPCKNGGTCIDQLAAFACECPIGTIGSQCETRT